MKNQAQMTAAKTQAVKNQEIDLRHLLHRLHNHLPKVNNNSRFNKSLKDNGRNLILKKKRKEL